MMNLESFYATPKGIVIHKQYDRKNVASEYDIALLNLERPLNFTNKIRPICMPKKGDIATGNFTVAGWGKTESSASSTVLLEAKVKEMDISGCKAFFKNISNLTLVDDKHICAG
ncbi:serine protease 76 precursor-like protein, partial [Leptotrombidium deliense]